jgi:hypothetical protein
VENDKVKPEGTKARCTVCKHVFTITPEDQDELVLDAVFPEESPSETPTDTFADPSLDTSADTPDFGETKVFGDALEEEAQKAAGDDDAAAAPADAEEPSAYSFSLGDDAPKDKKKKRVLPIVAVIVLLLLLIVPAAVWFIAPQVLPTSLSNMIASLLGEAPEKPEFSEDGFVILKNVRQYVLPNSKIGEILVMEGLVVNEFNTTKERIRVQADLFDKSGEILASKELVCGNTLDLVQLQSLSREEIQAALGNEAGILANNSDLQPGDETPCMIVFFEQPENMSEFRIEVVGVEDPEP